MNRIFAELGPFVRFVGMPAPIFAVEAAHVLSEINAVHPFREGNGRTQLTFLAIFAERAGFSFNADILDRDRVLAAMIRGFVGDEEPLSNLIGNIIA